MKKFNTSDFGIIEYCESDIIHFPKGIYGFEDQRDYVILHDSPKDELFFLQSVEKANLHFVILDPVIIDSNYKPIITDEDKMVITTENEEFRYLVIVAIKEKIEESVVNMKSPLVINLENRNAVQTILFDDKYDIRHPLFVKVEDGE